MFLQEGENCIIINHKCISMIHTVGIQWHDKRAKTSKKNSVYKERMSRGWTDTGHGEEEGFGVLS